MTRPAPPTELKVWHNNRLDQERTYRLDWLAEQYMASQWADALMLTERAVAGWLAADLHATWEDREAFNRLCDLVVQCQQQQRTNAGGEGPKPLGHGELVDPEVTQ